MGITHVLRGEDLLSSTPRQIALYRALVDIGVATCVPVFGHLPLVHGRGQQEALQARPAVEPVPAPRPWLHPRGAAQLPGPARLGDRRRPRHLHARGDGRGVRHRTTSTPTRRASTRRRPRRSTPTTSACSAPEDFAARLVPYLQRDGVLPADPSGEQLDLLAAISAAGADAGQRAVRGDADGGPVLPAGRRPAGGRRRRGHSSRTTPRRCSTPPWPRSSRCRRGRRPSSRPRCAPR